jgi:acetyltransferase-like isoleucine patch superfamily enzyme
MIATLLNMLDTGRRYALAKWWDFTLPGRLRRLGIGLEPGVRLRGMPIVSLAPASDVQVGQGAVLCSRSEFTALGVSRPVILRTLRPGARLQIGRNVGMSGSTLCAAQSVSIGDDCLLGADVLISDSDFHSLAPAGRRHNDRAEDIGARPVRIGCNVFIGARTVVLKGVSIGDNSVIGAGSVVTNDIPANVIAAGNPARVLRALGE